MHVIANPLLDEDCKKSCRKTEDKGHEPKGVYTYDDADGLKLGKGVGEVEGIETCGVMEEICWEI